MRRREFLGVLGSAAAWPVGARAQQTAMSVIGFLHSGAAAADMDVVAGFQRGLKESGLVEGQNIRIEFRWAEGHYEKLPALASDLVSRRVALIATGGGEPSVKAAKATTTTIPIVFSLGGDPVKAGLVSSLNRPAGNITGVNIFSTELDAKRLGLLHELLPPGAVIAHLLNPTYPPAEESARNVEAAARTLSRQIVVLKAATPSEIDAAFATISERRMRAVHVGADPFFTSRRDQIVALAAHYAIVATYPQRPFVVAGGLLSYGTNFAEAYRQMGIYAARILKGEKPGDLPVVQSAKFALVINLKTAKALGLNLPSGILSIADEVIE
jgi:putative tryptophan/tyrosine transport system substrate-binding protein